MGSRPEHICETDLSIAWAKAFLRHMDDGVSELSPLTVTIEGFEASSPKEDAAVRDSLDMALRGAGKPDCHTTANTIFPRALWNPDAGRDKLFERYLAILPKILKCRANQYGVYFQRLVKYGDEDKNQLDYIISTFNCGNHRQSALQASIIDPLKDQTDQRRRGFPCLQQIGFAVAERGCLQLTAFYPTQRLFERAYGNYLGLCRLGGFVAHETGRQLTRMTCFVGSASLGRPKRDLANLRQQIADILNNG